MSDSTSSATPAPSVGDSIAPLRFEPSRVQLFLFSAVTWNGHRIHYDAEYAREVEGHADVLVQSHLHACFVAATIRKAYGSGARLTRISWRNVAPAVPGDSLTISGTVVSVDPVDGGLELGLELEEHNQRDEVCVTAKAGVVIGGGDGSDGR